MPDLCGRDSCCLASSRSHGAYPFEGGDGDRVKDGAGPRGRQGASVSSKHRGGNIIVATGWRVTRIALVAVAFSCSALAQTRLTVSAAASLKEALVETETTYQQSHANV